MQTLLTGPEYMDLCTQYSVVVTRPQDQSLRIELSFAFWSAWALMFTGYVASLHFYYDAMAHPDQDVFLLAVVPCQWIFIILNTIASAVCRACHTEYASPRVSCKHVVCRITVDLVTRLAYQILLLIAFLLFTDLIFTSYPKVTQAAFGDTNYTSSRRFFASF